MTARIPATHVLPSGTLSKPSTSRSKPAGPSVQDRTAQNYRLALHHARRIQSQKDVEAQNLQTLLLLVDYPTDTDSPSTTQNSKTAAGQEKAFSRTDARNFTTLMQTFRPEDYDSLLEERRIDERCGYVLCRERVSGNGRKGGMGWNGKREVGAWCSARCREKAMYVRGQLNPTPAWERDGEVEVVLLHPDDRGAEEEIWEMRGEEDVKRLQVEDAKELARERGEEFGAYRPIQVTTEVVVERKPKGMSREAIEKVVGRGRGVAHGLIEGYQPKGVKRRTGKEEVGKSKRIDDESGSSDEGEE